MTWQQSVQERWSATLRVWHIRFWTTHKIGLFIFYTALVLHPLPGALRRVENPFAFNVSPLEWGYSDTWVRSNRGQTFRSACALVEASM